MEESLSFSGHQSFPFRNTWLTKGVVRCNDDPGIFHRDDAMVALGVGKNMVGSIRHWCLATRMITEDLIVKNNRGRVLKPTELGKRVFLTDGGWDPYLEDIGTLWLLHWLLVTNRERATTWRFAFNYIHQPEFTKAWLQDALWRMAAAHKNVRLTIDTLRRDIDVFVRTYTGAGNSSRQLLEDSLDCPLVELGILVEQGSSGSYAFMRGPKETLPDEVLMFALSEYFQRKPEQRSFTFDELAFGPYSPGRAFKLDESSLAERFDRLADRTSGAWQFTETAGYQQVLVTEEVDGMKLLDSYYQNAVIGKVGADR
ncbi:MAG: DUF4007 family protein [Chloroflexota bacterium]|jgi:hypothetical protein